MTTSFVSYATQPLGQPGTAFGASVSSLAILAATVPPAGSSTVYVYAVFDGEFRARIFNSSHSNYVLPTISYMAQILDPQATADGGWILNLTPNVPPLATLPTGVFNPDSNSPMNFVLDGYAVIVTTSGSVTAGDPTT
jgi:hypothetical protein